MGMPAHHEGNARGLRADELVSGDLERSDHVGDWQAFLQAQEEELVDELRVRTRTGRPCGDEAFVVRLERLVGRSLRPAKAGRPRKNKGGGREKCGREK